MQIIVKFTPVYIKVEKNFIKNFYYNKTGLTKLIFLYNYLSDVSFLEKLSLLVSNNNFFENEKKTEVLLEIHQKMIKNVTILNLNFGFVQIYEEKIIFYFKDDFEFDHFYAFFFNLEKNYKFKWKILEFFDKNIKILEIFNKEKDSFLRNFRNETNVANKKNKIKNFTITSINCEDKNFLFFLKKYETKNIKLVLYFYTIEV